MIQTSDTPFLKHPLENPEKLVVKYSQLKRRLSSFREQNNCISYRPPSPPTHPADKATSVTDTSIIRKTTTGNPDTTHRQRVSPLEVDRDASIGSKAVSKPGPFEQPSPENEKDQSTSEDRIPTPSLHSSPMLPPIPVAAETGPWINHPSNEPTLDGAQSRLAQNGGSLSTQSSFRSFSSEEDEGAIDLDSGEHAAGPEHPKPKTEEFPTPNPISAHGSFQAFSDEEEEETQSVPNNQAHSINQLLDHHTYNSIHLLQNPTSWRVHPPTAQKPNPAWPDISFAPAVARPEPSTAASKDPLSDKGDPPAATQGRWDSSDIATTSKLNHGAFIERNRRVKFDGQRPFTPKHRPFTPQTQMPTASHENCFPSSGLLVTEPQQHAWHPSPPHISGPGVSRFTEDGPDHDEEMIDVDSAIVTHSSPTIPSLASRFSIHVCPLSNLLYSRPTAFAMWLRKVYSSRTSPHCQLQTMERGGNSSLLQYPWLVLLCHKVLQG